MKKCKTLEQLKHYYRHYLATFPQVKRRGQPTVRQYLNKLKAQICQREAEKMPARGV